MFNLVIQAILSNSVILFLSLYLNVDQLNLLSAGDLESNSGNCLQRGNVVFLSVWQNLNLLHNCSAEVHSSYKVLQL